MEEFIPFAFIGFIVGFYAVTFWKVFEKAGEPGWTIFVPFYNLYRFVKIAGKPGYWALLYLVPGVNIVISLLTNLGIAQKFGRSDGFGVGLFLLDFVFYPILAFGDDEYEKEISTKEKEEDTDTFIDEDGNRVEKISLEDWK
jgi:hypothetical protein